MCHRQNTAFSLVELSIVLVILGLLVGGILGGKSLIHAAELRSLTTQQQQYYAAVKTFKDKYFALPGDMANATQFWGTATVPGSCNLTAGSGPPATCDGNGDGLVMDDGGSFRFEPKRFWQHLANAGLIAGQFVGWGNASTIFQTNTSNSPSGKVGGGVWTPWSVGSVTAGLAPDGFFALFNGDYGQTLSYGKVGSNLGIMIPEDAWNIDSKMDDGKPASGRMVTGYGMSLNACTDTTDATNLAANYLLSSTSTTACMLIFKNQF